MTDPANSASLIRNGRFARIWTVGQFCGVVRWLELLAYGIFAFDLTGSPLLVSLLVILRFLPLALFGAVMGAVSDLVGPRRLLLGGLAAVSATAAGMLALFLWGEPADWHVALAALVSGTFWAGDLPFRRRMLAEAVAPEALSSAVAVDGAAGNGTRMAGPLIGGALYGLLGMEGVFALSLVLYAVAIAVALTLPGEAPRPAGPRGAERLLAPVRGQRDAARHAWADPDGRRILMVTVVFNIWGFPYLAMIPVIGRDELGLSASAVGAITAVEGLFALIGSVLLTRPLRAGVYRALYFGAVACHLTTVLLMGAVGGVWVVAAGLAAGGLFAAGFSTMQTTLIYLVAPPEMRGRYLGLMTICIGAGVIGFANVGLTAELVGASNALIVIGLQGLIPLLLVARGWGRLAPRD